MTVPAESCRASFPPDTTHTKGKISFSFLFRYRPSCCSPRDYRKNIAQGYFQPRASSTDSPSHAHFEFLDASRILSISFRRLVQRISKTALLAMDHGKPRLEDQHVASPAPRLVFGHLIPKQTIVGRLNCFACPLVVLDEEIICLEDGGGKDESAAQNGQKPVLDST